jgi:hypothetical protein
MRVESRSCGAPLPFRLGRARQVDPGLDEQFERLLQKAALLRASLEAFRELARSESEN